jgi:hypothetical protein
MMLTLQTMMRTVEVDVRNGSSESKYHGKTTGAHKRDAAMGHAKRSEDHSDELLLSQIAVTKPARTANTANNSAGAT